MAASVNNLNSVYKMLPKTPLVSHVSFVIDGVWGSQDAFNFTTDGNDWHGKAVYRKIQHD